MSKPWTPAELPRLMVWTEPGPEGQFIDRMKETTGRSSDMVRAETDCDVPVLIVCDQLVSPEELALTEEYLRRK